MSDKVVKFPGRWHKPKPRFTLGQRWLRVNGRLVKVDENWHPVKKSYKKGMSE